METMVLHEPAIAPTNNVLEKAPGKSFKIFRDLMNTITGENYELLPEWSYYKDDKARLCKVQYKKKTIFWLSIWEKYFKIGLYFTEQTCKGINDLDIDINIKNNFKENKPIGRLLPLVIIVNKKELLKDALKVIDFKMRVK